MKLIIYHQREKLSSATMRKLSVDARDATTGCKQERKVNNLVSNFPLNFLVRGKAGVLLGGSESFRRSVFAV